VRDKPDFSVRYGRASWVNRNMYVHVVAFLMVSTCLAVDVIGRIGESAQESRARYGEDETLSDIKDLFDKTEVRHLLLLQKYKEMQKERIVLNVGETIAGLGEEKPQTTVRTREIDIKTLMSLRDQQPKFLEDAQDMEKKSDFAQQLYYQRNKANIQEFFGKDVSNIMEFQVLYSAVKNYLLEIERSPPSWFINYKDMKYSEERLAALKTEIKSLEDSLQKISNGVATGYQKMTFNKSGFKIYAYFYNNKTYKMIFLSENINENDVFDILKNNSDGNSAWESQQPADVVDETNWKVLMEYKTSDDKLHAKFGKYRTDMNDFGSMRGVVVWLTDVQDPYKEKSRAANL